MGQVYNGSPSNNSNLNDLNDNDLANNMMAVVQGSGAPQIPSEAHEVMVVSLTLNASNLVNNPVENAFTGKEEA